MYWVKSEIGLTLGQNPGLPMAVIEMAPARLPGANIFNEWRWRYYNSHRLTGDAGYISNTFPSFQKGDMALSLSMIDGRVLMI